MADFKDLPAGYKAINLNDPAMAEQRDALLAQVFDNLRLKSNYQGVYGDSESFDDWKSRLDIADPKAAQKDAVRIYAITGPDGKVSGFSYAEIYQNGSALIGYTCGDGDAQGKDYDNVIAASKRGIAEVLKGSGLITGAAFQEHILGKNKAKHEAKGMVGEVIGQVPLVIDGKPVDYTIPLYKGDIYDLMKSGELEKKFGHLFEQDEDKSFLRALPNGADGKGPTAEQIEMQVKRFTDRFVEVAREKDIQALVGEAGTSATLLMADPAIAGGNPDAKLADVLKTWMDDYVAKNSVFKQHPELDPGFQSVKKMVEHIQATNPDLTLGQAHRQSVEYSQRMSLNNPASLMGKFNRQAYDATQMQAMQIMGHAAAKWELKDRAVELLYHGDGSPETLKAGLTLMQAAAMKGPDGQKGNFQAMRDLARFYYEGGIGGKSFKDLGLSDFIGQDIFHAYQLGQEAKLTHPEKFNDISGAGLSTDAQMHVRLLQDMGQNEKLKPFVPALQEQDPAMMAGMGH